MDRTLIWFFAITLCGYVVMAALRPPMASEALDHTAEMFLQAVPWIIVSMFAAGLLSQLFQPHLVARFFGREAGIIGVVIAALLGLFGTGSRWAVYPLGAGLLAAESSPGAVFAFVTSWQLVSLSRLPAEVPFFGLQFTLVRAILSVLLSVLGGVIMDKLI